jgi:protocatechuate 3,4-dioxygenase beta subunit
MTRFLPLLAILALVSCGDDDSDEAPAKETRRETAAVPAANGFPKTPKCRAPAETTPAQTEGPYYTERPPRRRSFVEAGVRGRRLVLRGRVLSTDCKPLAGARVDFWQADGEGEYDNQGYRLRGYQLTDAKGRYRLTTVAPAQYESRAPHIHVKVTPRGGETLTSQLYLPGAAANRSDPIFDRDTLLRLRRGSGTWRGAFDFVVSG